MALRLCDSSVFEGIADAIRTKKKTSDPIPVSSFAAEISNLGDLELNLAFGTTPPDDTSKVWVQAPTPTKVTIRGDVDLDGTTYSAKAISSTVLAGAASEVLTATIGTTVYVFEARGSRRIRAFDTNTGTHTTVGALSTLGFTSAVAVGTDVYLFGNGSKTIEKYSTSSAQLTTLSAQLPYTLHYLAAAAVGNTIYMFGGATSTYTMYNKIYALNTTTGAISTLTPTLPVSMFGATAVAVGEKIYIFGGTTSTTGGRQTAIYCFNTSSKAITTMSATLPEGLAFMGGALVGEKIHLFGGMGHDGTTSYPMNSIVEYTPSSDRIKKLSSTLPAPMYDVCVGAIGDKAYLFGGYVSSTERDNTVYEWWTFSDLALGELVVKSSLSKNVILSISNASTDIRFGFEKVFYGDTSNTATVVGVYVYDEGWTSVGSGATSTLALGDEGVDDALLRLSERRETE